MEHVNKIKTREFLLSYKYFDIYFDCSESELEVSHVFISRINKSSLLHFHLWCGAHRVHPRTPKEPREIDFFFTSRHG